MTDLEISKALALAIGWTEDRLDENGCLDPDVIIEGAAFGQEAGVFVWRDGFMWERFDYRDPAVIWRIAERYNCFPLHQGSSQQRYHGMWVSWRNGRNIPADTAAKAVALAVIGSAA